MVLRGSTSAVWRCNLRFYLFLDSEEEDHGRNGEGRAPAATSVPVPRPVARGLADRRQVRMQLFASFTRGALNPLRICVPGELITLTKRYSSVSLKHFSHSGLAHLGPLMCWDMLLPAELLHGCCNRFTRLVCAQRRLLMLLNVSSRHS